jgi:hypothetical protein
MSFFFKNFSFFGFSFDLRFSGNMFGYFFFVLSFSSFLIGFDNCFYSSSVNFVCLLSIISCFLCYLVSCITFVSSSFGIIICFLNFFRTSIFIACNNLGFHSFMMRNNFSLSSFMNFFCSMN